MTDNRKVQLEVTADGSQAKQEFKDVASASKQMGQNVQSAGKQASEGIKTVGTGANSASQQLTRAERSMINSIERTTAAMKAGGRTGAEYYETLARQRGVNEQVLAPYISQLREAEKAQNVAQGSLNNMGLSAKQTTAALRQVPMQFTDIVVSLQAGQRPMTVLMQQGGQLKDIFGGIGPAARAMGGYIAGLINPFTVLAAAAGALYLAYSQGNKEAAAYSRALVMTGNAANVTTGELAMMAERLSEVAGTERRAAGILAEMASTGEIGAKQLERFAEVAVQLESKVGIPVSETVKRMAELGKSPLEASLKLNEQYRYLTEEVYRHIKALQAQGREEAAAVAAQNAFADAMAQRAQTVQQNLGLLEKAWKGVKDMATGAWDAMLDLGRAVSPEEALRRQMDAIADTERRIAEQTRRFGKPRSETVAELEALRRRLDLMRAETEEAKRQSAAEAERTAKEQDAIARLEKSGKEYERQQKAIEQQIKNLRIQADTFGMTAEQILLYNLALDGATDRQQAQAAAIQQQIESNNLLAEAWSYVQSTQDEALKREQAQIQSNYAAADSYLKMIDPMRGVQREMQKIRELQAAGLLNESEANAAVKKIVDAYRKANDEGVKVFDNFVQNVQRNMGDGLYKAMKGNFDNIGDAFLDLLLRMSADAAAANLSKAMFGGGADGWWGTFASWLTGGVAANAKGGVYGSASLSGYRNQVHDKTQFFAFAKGGAPNVGVFGEAGAEAIMPLTRTPDGNLGVRAVGGDRSVSVSVAVDAKGSRVEGNDQQSNQLGQMIGSAVRGVIIQEMRPGGLLAGGN